MSDTDNSKKPSIYDYDDRIKRTYNLIKKDLSQNNQEIITRYDREMITLGLGKATRHKNLQIVLNLSRFLGKDWTGASKNDIDDIVIKITELYSDNYGKETYTSYDHKKILKIFFRWFKLGSRDQKEVGDPIETKNIKIKRVKDKISREDLLTESDLTRLLFSCGEHLRDKALIDCHLEAGTRPGEILNLQIKHVEIDTIGAILKVDGKTGARTIRLVRSVPNLVLWINNHPMKNNPDAPLWINQSKRNFGEPLSYSSAYQMIKRVCKKAGISKRVYPNLFRHTEATELANHLTEAQMKARHGWTPYSKMPGRYVHLNNSDVEEAILSKYGLSNKKEEQKQKLPKLCSRCDTHNAHDAEICIKCTLPLDAKTAMMQEEKIKHDKDLLESKIEQIRSEFNQKLENIERQRNTRTSAFTNVISDIGDDSAREFLSTMYYLFELINPEDTKQSMWKKFAKYRCKPLTQEILDSDFAEEQKIGIERMKILFNQS